MQELQEEFLQELPPTSSHTARIALASFGTWFTQTTGDNWTLENWTTPDTRTWASYLLTTRKRKPNTVNAYLSMLKSFAAWCQDKGHLTRNPVLRVKKVQFQKAKTRALQRDEELRLLRSLEGSKPITQFIVRFLLHTGLRASEFTHLQLDDITLGEQQQQLSVLVDNLPTPKAIRTGMLLVRAGKGMKTREVPLNATAREALLEYVATRPPVEYGHVLISSRRIPMAIQGVEYACESLREIARIPDLHPHLLRATCGTKLARSGVPLEVVAELLGHSHIETTRQFYISLDPKQLQNALERIEE